MTRITEDRHAGEPWLLWKLGNLTAVDSDSVKSKAWVWGYRFADKWFWTPLRVADKSLYYNGILFMRVCWPLGVFVSVRWSASTTAKALLQIGAGWKINGRFALIARVQSDASSAAGTTGPNVGQATGFDYGTH